MTKILQFFQKLTFDITPFSYNLFKNLTRVLTIVLCLFLIFYSLILKNKNFRDPFKHTLAYIRKLQKTMRVILKTDRVLLILLTHNFLLLSFFVFRPDLPFNMFLIFNLQYNSLADFFNFLVTAIQTGIKIDYANFKDLSFWHFLYNIHKDALSSKDDVISYSFKQFFAKIYSYILKK